MERVEEQRERGIEREREGERWDSMTYPRPGGASWLPLHAVVAASPALDPNHKHRKKRLKKS